jgi:hypothetical protein
MQQNVIVKTNYKCNRVAHTNIPHYFGWFFMIVVAIQVDEQGSKFFSSNFDVR